VTNSGKKYLCDIRSLLPNSKSEKHRIMERMEKQLNDFYSEEPQAGYDELCSRFGTPTEIAASALMEEGPGKVLEQLQLRRRIMQAVIGFLLAAFVLFGAVAVWFVIEVRSTRNLHVEETGRTVYIIDDEGHLLDEEGNRLDEAD